MDLVLIAMTWHAHRFMQFGLEVKLISKQESGVNSDPRQIINWFGGFLHRSVKKSLFMNYKMNLFLFHMTLEKPLKCFMSSFAYI